jgi:hypothetical protein
MENFVRTAASARPTARAAHSTGSRVRIPLPQPSNAKRGELGRREMAITRFVFGMVVLATLLIAAPAAHAACRSPKNICKHFDDCLQRTSDPNNKDADGIRAGVKARNGDS